MFKPKHRRKPAVQPTKSPVTIPIPERLLQEAQAQYSMQRSAQSFNLTAESIDKLHTMYVVADGQVRIPTDHDKPILDLLVASCGAAMAMNPALDLKPLASKTAFYLADISAWSEKFTLNPSLYPVATMWLIDGPYLKAANNVMREAGIQL